MTEKLVKFNGRYNAQNASWSINILGNLMTSVSLVSALK